MVKNEGTFLACKRKEEQQQPGSQPPGPKKPRLVFTDIQRRTLQVRTHFAPNAVIIILSGR